MHPFSFAKFPTYQNEMNKIEKKPYSQCANVNADLVVHIQRWLNLYRQSGEQLAMHSQVSKSRKVMRIYPLHMHAAHTYMPCHAHSAQFIFGKLNGETKQQKTETTSEQKETKKPNTKGKIGAHMNMKMTPPSLCHPNCA